MKIDSNERNQPLVSIIMNCYNGEKYLREAIDSIYAQTYQNWEIIFWDNASQDSSAEIANSYDEKLQYFKGESTIKLYAARNKALEHCSGEFIAFLDCDDAWLPKKLEKQMPLFDDVEVSLVYCDSLFFKDNGWSRRNFLTNVPYKGFCTRQLIEKYILDIESVTLRKSTLLDNDVKFDDQYNIVGDADLFIRVSLYGKIDYVNEVLSKWRIHADNLSFLKIENNFREMREMFHTMFSETGFEKYRKIIDKSLSKVDVQCFVQLIKNKKIGQIKTFMGNLNRNKKIKILFSLVKYCSVDRMAELYVKRKREKLYGS